VSDHALEALLRPTDAYGAALVGANVTPFPPRWWLPGEVARFFDWRLEDRYRAIGPLSYYGAYGRALVLARRLFSRLSLPANQADDLFIYFTAMQRRESFSYVAESIVFFSAPRFLREYAHQFARYWFYLGHARIYFGDDLVEMGISIEGHKRLVIAAAILHPYAFGCWAIGRVWSKKLLKSPRLRSSLSEGLY